MSRIRANNITNLNANGAPNFPDGINVTGVVTTSTIPNPVENLTVTGNAGVAGTVTYEDVTDIDSVGVVTARTGIKIGPTAGVAATVFSDGSINSTGIITASTYHGSGANLTGIVGVPTGCILLWYGAANAIPSGFILCNGSNGTPDLRGKFVDGYHDGNGDYDVGDTGGAETVTLTIAQIPSHKHTTNIDGQHVIPGGGGSSYPYGGGGTYASRLFSMDNTGGGGAHENRPPFYALCYIMKT